MSRAANGSTSRPDRHATPSMRAVCQTVVPEWATMYPATGGSADERGRDEKETT
jgi:hypothetical protein